LIVTSRSRCSFGSHLDLFRANFDHPADLDNISGNNLLGLSNFAHTLCEKWAEGNYGRANYTVRQIGAILDLHD
jgi:hypothetical protein